MLTIELHRIATKLPIRINIGSIIYYEPDGKHCRIVLYGNKNKTATASDILVDESYDKVQDILSRAELIDRADWMAFQVGTYQYLDFLRNEESNPLRDEYLRWKGMHKLASE